MMSHTRDLKAIFMCFSSFTFLHTESPFLLTLAKQIIAIFEETRIKIN